MSRALVLLVLLGVGCGSDALPPTADGRAERAKTIEPGCNGSAYTTIQAAIDAAVDGDVIEICGGTYYERLSIVGKQLTLRPKGLATVTVDAQGLGTTLSVTDGADVVVEDLVLIGGSSAIEGGNVRCTSSTLEISSVVIAFGEAQRGGGLAAAWCTGFVAGSTFEDNEASDGGGAYVLGDTLDLEDNHFTWNAAEKGGGLYVDGNSAIRGNRFVENAAERYGGGVYVFDGAGEIVDNDVEGNTSGNDGAGMYLLRGTPTVEGNVFVGNDSGDDAGGLRVKSGSPTIVGNTFVDNHAALSGGGAKISHDEVVMAHNLFERNVADYRGGALLLEESASLLSGDVFVDNTAWDGGGIAIERGWGAVEIVDAAFHGNVATDDGGQIFVSLEDHAVKLRRVELVGGTASYGGAVFAVNSELDFENTLAWDNVATAGGGALWLDGTGGALRNVVAWRNDGPDGAALAITNGVALDVVNTAFGKNLTSAAIEVHSGAAPLVSYCNFNGNASNFAGMASLIGIDGNLSGKAGFVSPGQGDFRLQGNSKLIDAGDPSVSDLDGTRSDIGLYGGPNAG